MWKASREPKKGGAGGGYTWGKAGKQDLVEVKDSKNDPAYDSGDEDNVVMQRVDVYEKDFCDEGQKTEDKKDVVRRLKKSKSLTSYDGLVFFPSDFNLKEFIIHIRTSVDEYLESGDRTAAVKNFEFDGLPKVHSFLVARLIQIMIEKDEAQREEILQLIKKMPYLTAASIRRGFDRVYWVLPDVIIDVPNAPNLIKEILVRMISERLIPKEILSRVPVLVLKCMSSPDFSTVIEGLDLTKSIPEEKEKATELAREYLSSRDSEEILKYYQSSEKAALFKSYLAKKLIEISFDGKNEDKNFACRALKEHAKSGFFTTASIKYALDDLVWNLKDLSVDIPEVSSTLAKLIARLVLEETVTATYLIESELTEPELGDDNIEGYCLFEAFGLKDQLSFQQNLDGIWGTLATIDSLKEVIKNNIDEFLISKDEQEALRQFKRLKCPYYMHEFVKRVIVMAIEREGEERDQLICLTKLMWDQLLVNNTQLHIGLKRVEDGLKDLSLDVPRAEEIHKELLDKLQQLDIGGKR